MHGPASTVPTDRPSSLTTEMPEIEELRDELARLRGRLAERDREAEQRELELRASYEATVRALADAVEARDAYTARHAERVAAYGLEIARACGLETEDGPDLEFGFLLHDIGKVGVPDAILFKSAPLSSEERACVAAHAEIGAAILRHVDFLDEATLIVRHHHERWDGTGYPDRLEGDQIPLAARASRSPTRSTR
jgi:putative nucleotidyltransferase with HDIG domain